MSEKNTKKPSDSASTEEYGEIYSNSIDIESIEQNVKNQKIVVHGCIIGFFLILICVFFSLKNNAMANQDYIGGNIMRIAITNGQQSDRYNIANPWKNASFLGMLTFRSLFLTDSTYTEVNPRLAEKYELLDDGCTYVITMRENQFWSDGQPITVDDVVFSFHAFLSCKDVNSNMSAAFNRILGVEDYISGTADTISGITSEGNTITIKIDAPYSTFALMLTQFVPLPQHILKDEDLSTLTSAHEFFVNENPICSGEFMVQGLDEDKNVILVRNPQYTDALSDIETILVCWDYENTELDYYPTSDLTKMVSYRSMKGYEEHEVEVYYYRYFVFNMAGGDEGEENAVTSDVRVRQAIYHALDVETLLNEVYLGKGQEVFGGAITVAEQVYEYNPEKAKQLLNDANYDFKRPFTIYYYSSDTNSRIFLDRVASYLEAVGLTVELVKSSASALYQEPTYDMMMKNLSSINTEDWYNEYISTNANLSQLLGREGEFDSLVSQLNQVTTLEDYMTTLEELVALEQGLLYKMPMFILGEAIYINENRLYVPEDIVFGNTRYRSDLRFNEWYVKKE